MHAKNQPITPAGHPLAAHLDLVYSAALRQVRDPHLAEDVAQSVLLLALKKRHLPADHLPAWLVKVTRDVAANALRSNARRRRHESLAPAPPAQHSPEPALLSFIDEALADLPEPDRRILVLRFFQNTPSQQIAAALDISPNAAAKRIERALNRLRQKLHRRGITTLASTAILAATLDAIPVHAAPITLTNTLLPLAAKTVPATLLGVLLMSTKFKIAAAAILLLILALIAVPSLAPTTPSIPSTPTAQQPSPPSPPNTKTTALTGTVTDDTGKPLPGILVSQGSNPDYSFYRHTTTDDAGRFTLTDVELGRPLHLAAQYPGYAPSLIAGTVTENLKPYTFKLKPARTLRLRVLDARGQPMPNLELSPSEWRNTNVLQTGYMKPAFFPYARTDGEGRLTWNAAPTDPVTFRAHLTSDYLNIPFVLTATDEEQTIAVPDAIRLTAYITDAHTAKPIPNTTVSLNWDKPVSITDGHFSATITYARPLYSLRVEAPGYPPLVHGFNESAIPQDGSTLSLNLKLSKKSLVELTVLNPDKSPAVNAPVYLILPVQGLGLSLEGTELFNPKPDGTPIHTPVKSDAAGIVRLPKAKDDRTLVVVVSENGFAIAPAPTAPSAWDKLAGTTPPSVTLKPWAKITGTAYLGPDLAVNQIVGLQYEADHPGAPMIHATLRTTTDDKGKFSFDRVPPGNIKIGRGVTNATIVSAPMQTITNVTRLRPDPGQSLDLTLGNHGRTVTGRIVDAAGQPAPSTWVYHLANLKPTPPEPRPEFPKHKFPDNQTMQGPGYKEALKIFHASPEYLAYKKAEEKYIAWVHDHPTACFTLNRDGTFTAHDIAPGPYTFELIVLDATKSGKVIARINQTITIPTATPATTPFDLGKIPAK